MPPAKSRRGKLFLLMAVVVAAILVVAAIGFVLMQRQRHDFTIFEGTNFYTYHYSSGTVKSTASWQWTNDESYYVGEKLDFWFKLFNNGNGTMVLTAAACNLSQFSFASGSPALPVALPNTNSQDNGVEVAIYFNTPSTPYTGGFHLYMYYDWYASIESNDISSVTETQVVTTHSHGDTTTYRVDVPHPEFAGGYHSGAMMTLNEVYHPFQGVGNCSITAIVANTTGFKFLASNPALPLDLPEPAQPSVVISLNFSVPAETEHDGPFSYIVYFDIFTDTPGPDQHDLTSVREVQHVTTYLGSLNSTVTYVHWHNDTAGLYPVGEEFTISEPYWNSGGSGAMSVASITANTTGFSVSAVSPQLPALVPNSPDGSTNVTLLITFVTPAIQYVGPFEYIVHLDYRL